jgi:hypothetical protein
MVHTITEGVYVQIPSGRFVVFTESLDNHTLTASYWRTYEDAEAFRAQAEADPRIRVRSADSFWLEALEGRQQQFTTVPYENYREREQARDRKPDPPLDRSEADVVGRRDW